MKYTPIYCCDCKHRGTWGSNPVKKDQVVCCANPTIVKTFDSIEIKRDKCSEKNKLNNCKDFQKGFNRADRMNFYMIGAAALFVILLVAVVCLEIKS